MKIKFTSGPKAGTIEHLQPSIANVIIASGMAEHIPYANYVERLNEENAAAAKKNMQPPAVVTWVNAFGNLNNRHYIGAKCSRPNCSKLVYDGPASALESITFIHSAGCAAPEKIPAVVCEQYRHVYQARHVLGRDEIDCAIAAIPRTKEDWEAEKAVASMKERYEAVAERDPHQRPYGIGHYAPTVDLPYDMTGVKKK